MTEIVQAATHLNKKRYYTEDKTEQNKPEPQKVDIMSSSEPNHTLQWAEELEMESEVIGETRLIDLPL